MSANPERPPLDRWRADALLDPERKLWGLPLIAEALGVSIDTARTWAKMDGAAVRICSSLRGWLPRRTRVLRAKRVASVGFEYMMVSLNR